MQVQKFADFRAIVIIIIIIIIIIIVIIIIIRYTHDTFGNELCYMHVPCKMQFLQMETTYGRMHSMFGYPRNVA